MTVKSGLGNLGDNLWLTPLLLHGIVSKIQMFDAPVCREVGKIFENLGEVEYTNTGGHCQEVKDKIHRAAAHLKYFGCEKSCIPKLEITEAEMEMAKYILIGINNPVAVNFTTMNKGGDYASSRRVMTSEQANFTARKLIENGYMPVNLGLSSNTSKIQGVINILDLGIRDTSACYKMIGKYVGTETGTSSLMIACGGKAVIYHPDSCDLYYPAWKYHFTDEYWKEEPCRAKYFNFNELYNIDEQLKFLLN